MIPVLRGILGVSRVPFKDVSTRVYTKKILTNCLFRMTEPVQCKAHNSPRLFPEIIIVTQLFSKIENRFPDDSNDK